MSAFQPFLSVIETYENEDILFIWDPDEEKQSDCNFYFCTAIDTFEAEKSRLGISDDGLAMDPEEMAQKKEEEEQERKRKEAEEEKKREDERIALAIAELKKPMIARKWKDLGSYDEIQNNKLAAKAQKLSICLSRKRRAFGQKIEFSDSEGMKIEMKSLRSGYDAYIYKKLTDKNIQIGGRRTDECTQTQWNRKMNRIIQYEFNEESIKNKNKSQEISIQTDDAIGFVCDDDTKTEEEEELRDDDFEDEMNDKLEQFLFDISASVSRMLSDNDVVNIFLDDFALFVDGDAELGLDTKTENIREIQTFVDLNWSGGKKISHIEWMASSNKVAVSCIEKMSFDDRVAIVNKSRISSILLWNLSHILLRAQTILTAPSDIFTFKLHPHNENIVIGGLETGQVVLWDLTQKTPTATTTTATDQEELNCNDDFVEDEEDKIPQIEPQMMSYIERSHTKTVGDLLWLPQDVMVTSGGDLLYLDLSGRPKGPYKHIEEEQFMSISGDGAILFWAIEAPKQTEKEKKKNEKAKWIPIYSKKLSKTSLSESLFADKETHDRFCEMEKECEETDDDDDDGSGKESEMIFGCKMCLTPVLGKMCIGTELGEFCMVNYGKITGEFASERGSLLLSAAARSSASYAAVSVEEEKEEDAVQQQNNEKQLRNSILSTSSAMRKQHLLDIKSVCISPHFGDIYLTIGDWRFCIWRNNKLIFVSPYSSSYICCGCWSPTRPAVIITAKYDGTLDIWDLLDQTHAAVYKNAPISSTAITSIMFSPNSNEKTQLAVADQNGNLRILQIPRNFAIPLNNEKCAMACFYEKESVRIKFINKRSKMHKKIKIQMDRAKKEEEKENQQKQAAAAANDATNTNKYNNNDDDEDGDDQINIEKIQNKYQKMLLSFKKQIGIKS
eukprot:547726_1